MSRSRWYLAMILAPLLALQLVSLIYYFEEQKTLSAYLNRVANPLAAQSEQVKALVLSLKDKQGDTTDSYFLCPVFRFLRPTPLQVVTQGGDCADRSRLIIALLRLRGIQASKWALYNAQEESKHAVIEADVESGKMVADPLFGLWFPKPQGGYYAISELKNDPNILLRRVDELRAQGADPGVAPLEFYEFDQYMYTNARTINWTKSSVMRTCFRVLHFFLGDGLNQIRRPSFVEEPPLMVIYGVGALELGVLFVWFLLWRWKRTARSANYSRLGRTSLAEPGR